MALVLFSTLTNNQTIAFNPATDVLQFDNPAIGASSLTFAYSASNDNIAFTAL